MPAICRERFRQIDIQELECLLLFGCRGRGLGRLDRRGALRPRCFRIVFVEEDGGQPPPHVPFGVAGEQAQEHAGADMGFAADETDRTFS